MTLRFYFISFFFWTVDAHAAYSGAQDDFELAAPIIRSPGAISPRSNSPRVIEQREPHSILSSFFLALTRTPSRRLNSGTYSASPRSRANNVLKQDRTRIHSFLPLEGARHLGISMSDQGTSMNSEASFWRNKRVLVVGASSGLGESIALELTARGAKLTLAARRADFLTSLAQKCASIPGSFAPSFLVMDVTDSRETLAAKAEEAATLLDGPIDVLLYTAGVGQRTFATETSVEVHQRLMATNFEGAVALSQAVLPSMIDRRQGNIVVVSSVQGFFGQPGRSSYAASKAAMVGYFDALRAEVCQYGIEVSVVAPGYIATDHAASALGKKGAGDDAEKKGMPPEELAIKIADGVEQNKKQIVESQLDGRIGMLLRALWPSAFFKLMERKAIKS